jgi:hypothetical protein
VLQHDRFNSISVQLSDPHLPADRREKAEMFLETYLKTSSSINVYWGDAGPFLNELIQRVEQASPQNGWKP